MTLVNWYFRNKVVEIFSINKSCGASPLIFKQESTKRGATAIPSWISLAALNGVESPLCSLANLLSLSKDASLHLRKLARHLIGRMPECRDVYGCTITTMARLTQFAYSPCGNSEGMMYTCGSGVIGRLLRHKKCLSDFFNS